MMLNVEENTFSDEEMARFLIEHATEQEALAYLKDQVIYTTDGVRLLNLWGWAEGVRSRSSDAAVVEQADEVTEDILENEDCLASLVEWAELSGRDFSIDFGEKYYEALRSVYDPSFYTDPDADDEEEAGADFEAVADSLVVDVKAAESSLFIETAWSFIHDEYSGDAYGPLTEAFIDNPATPESVRAAAQTELQASTPTGS